MHAITAASRTTVRPPGVATADSTPQRCSSETGMGTGLPHLSGEAAEISGMAGNSTKTCATQYVRAGEAEADQVVSVCVDDLN